MLTLKFLAGLGTILLFAAFYCFKAAFNRQNNTAPAGHTGKMKKKNRLPLILGVFCIAAGLLVFIQLIRQL